MEISHFADTTIKSVSNRELGFDFLAKPSFSSNTILQSDLDNGDEVIEQNFNNGGAVDHQDEDDDDDGFRTPTLMEMRIKMIETCPPAPRKPPPPPPSRKRKALFPVDQSAMVAEIASEIAKLSPEKKARIFTAPATVV